jgi:hypothetical protein
MIEGLAKQRAALATDIAETQERLRKLAEDLSHIDATLRIVAPDFQIESVGPIFRPPSDWSRRGEMSRVMLDILRMARNPMTSREIAAQMIVERGLTADGATLNTMTKRCSTALRALSQKGLAVWEEGEAGFWKLWTIAR